ncbi:Coiled-coil domain-containing protein 61 [Sparganum proliferum]
MVMDQGSPPYFHFTADFSGQEHVLSFINTRQHYLKVEVRNVSTLEEWHASFTANYIEDMTRRTGNFKNFRVFTAMLRKLIAQVHHLREELYNRKEPIAPDESSHSESEQLEIRIKTIENERDSAVRKVSQLRSFLQALNSGESGQAENELGDDPSPRNPISRQQTNGRISAANIKHDSGVNNEKLLTMQVEQLTRELAKYRGKSTPIDSTDLAKMSSKKSNWFPSRTGNNSDTKFPYREQPHVDPEAGSILGVSPHRRTSVMRQGLPTSTLLRSNKDTHELMTSRAFNPNRSRARSADSIPRFTLPNGTFDPTAYVLYRDRKREAIAQRRCIERLTNMNNSRVISPHSLTGLSRSRSASDQERCADWDHCASPSCALPRRLTPLNGLRQRSPVYVRSTPSPSPGTSRGSSAVRGAGLSRHMTESLRPALRRWRSPRSRQLLSAAGALSDSESETAVPRRSSVPRRTDSSSRGASICTDAGDNICHNRRRSLHRSRSCGRSRRNAKENIQGSNSCKQYRFQNRSLQMDVELSDMDRRLNVLQNFFDNYFVAGV